MSLKPDSVWGALLFGILVGLAVIGVILMFDLARV